MASKNTHNELYKLAIEMHKYNGKGVKWNLDYLLSQEQARNNARNNSTQLSLPIHWLKFNSIQWDCIVPIVTSDNNDFNRFSSRMAVARR